MALPALAAGAALTAHFAHAAIGLILAMGVVGVVWRERRSALREEDALPTIRPSAPYRRGVGVAVVALASCAAAAVHADVMPAHFRESAMYGAFFLVAAVCQLGYAVVVFKRPTPPVLAVGAVANALVVILWLVTRLVAVPLGPSAGSREGFGRLDMTASLMELAIVVVATLLLFRRDRAALVEIPRQVRRRDVRSHSAASPVAPSTGTEPPS